MMFLISLLVLNKETEENEEEENLEWQRHVNKGPENMNGRIGSCLLNRRKKFEFHLQAETIIFISDTDTDRQTNKIDRHWSRQTNLEILLPSFMFFFFFLFKLNFFSLWFPVDWLNLYPLSNILLVGAQGHRLQEDRTIRTIKNIAINLKIKN